jgi:4-amino-4-deoxy-L-arabinose transferase-like glycosyltransferase
MLSVLHLRRFKYWLEEKKWAFEVDGGEWVLIIIGIIAAVILFLIIRGLAAVFGVGIAAIIAIAILLLIVWSESR